MTFEPDAEARDLAWARAEAKGAKQLYVPVRNPSRARQIAAEADPTSILDDPVVLEADEPFVGTITVTFSLDLEPFKEAIKAMEKVTAAFAGVMDSVAYKTLYENTFGIPVPDVQRRRHGNASLCPRHGPTKGGLCRRCAR